MSGRSAQEILSGPPTPNTSGSYTQKTDESASREDVCLSELYLLLQNSVSQIDLNPHHSLDTLTLMMEKICSAQESLQNNSPLQERLEFWTQVNSTWIFVVQSVLKTKALGREDWKAVCETVVVIGNVLSLYGAVDYPVGFAESKIVEVICDGITDL